MAYARLLDRAGRLSGPDINRLHIRLIAYLAREDEESRGRRRSEQFQDFLLAVNPTLYNDIYDERGNPKVAEEEGVDWEIPKTEDDVQRMLRDLDTIGGLPR